MIDHIIIPSDATISFDIKIDFILLNSYCVIKSH